MTLTLLVITDGRRELLERTLGSLSRHVDTGTIDHRVVVNDCPDRAFRDWIYSLDFDVYVPPQPRRRGFAGAIAAGWNVVPEHHWLFHLEDDFEFSRDIDITAMRTVLEDRPYLAQMALRRQAWNDAERAAGGVIELHPDDYADRTDGTHSWLEHRRFFTTNPNLYPPWVRSRSWPLAQYSEGIFTHNLLQDSQIRFGYWGQRTDEPWVTHIGDYRAGAGY